MIRSTKRHCRNIIVAMLLITAGTHATAQTFNPMWSTIGGPLGQTLSDMLISTGDEPDWINCDIYSDMSMITPQNELIAIVWDEKNNDIVHYYIYDVDAATVVDSGSISNARHPDVVIGDDVNGPNGTPGNARIIIVYEDLGSGNDIVFDYLDVANCMGHPGSPTSSGLQGPILVSSGSDPAYYPHIDAFFADPGGTKYFNITPQPDYIELGEFVITWTENVSAVDKIFVENGVFNAPIPGTPVLAGNVQPVADGRRSDIAGVRSMSMNAERWAHLVYIDDNDDLVYNFYDIDNGTFSPTVLETAGTGSSPLYNVLGWPRIEATNIHNPSAPNTINWTAVALLDSSSTLEKMHVYNPIGTINLAAYDPWAPDVAGFPAVSTGPGMNDITQLSQHGNTKFQFGYYIEDAPGHYVGFVALDEEVTGSHISEYQAVNNNAIHASVDHVLALGESSNCGHGFMAAWNNFESMGGPPQHTIGWKFSPTANINGGYKPGKPANVGKISPDLFVISPNPAYDYVNVNGINARTVYTITDMAGRLISQGNIDKGSSRINTASLTQGMYIVHFNENGNHAELKLVKQ